LAESVTIDSWMVNSYTEASVHHCSDAPRASCQLMGFVMMVSALYLLCEF